MVSGADWYERIPETSPLSQGDLVVACPVLTWSSTGGAPKVSGGKLGAMQEELEFDAVVLTQVCDLAQNKVKNVVLCPHFPLSETFKGWQEGYLARNKQKSDADKKERTQYQDRFNNKWREYCDKIVQGQMPHFHMLNCHDGLDPKMEHRVADFSQVFSLPRDWLEALLAQREGERSRLRSPYKEHLNQAFGRFFMRIGLEEDVDRKWNKTTHKV